MPRRAEPLQSTRLFHCVALALLLHVWLVLVVGTAPSGTAKPGDGVWGSLNVTLRGPRAEPGDDATALPVPPTPANAGPVGSGRQERFGGAVRPITAPADLPKTPGAARLGAWSDTAAAEPRPAPVPVPAQPLPEPPPPPLLAAEPLPKPIPTAAKPVEATPVESRPQPRLLSFDAAPAAALERLTQPVLKPVSPALPAAPVTKLEPLPQRESVKTAPAPAPAPAAPAPAPPAPLLAAPLSLEAIELRPALPSVLPPVLAPALTAAPQLLVAKPVAVPAAARIAPPERLLPAADVELKTQPQPKPVAELASPATAATAATAPIASSPAANPATDSATTRAAAATPKPSVVDPGLLGLVPSVSGAPGAPDAGPRVGQDVATPPSASASAPRLNLQWVPPRGGELSSRGSRGVLQLLPVPPEHKTKLSEEMEKAGKADCRKAYGGIGLLAVLPLVLDAARDKGCQWK